MMIYLGIELFVCAFQTNLFETIVGEWTLKRLSPQLQFCMHFQINI